MNSTFDFSKVCWVVDELLQERQYDCGFPKLADALRDIGCQVYQTKYVSFSTNADPDIPFGDESCVVTHGSIQFVRQIAGEYPSWCPGSYFNKNVKSFSKFAAHLGGLLLNDDFYCIPYAEFLRRGVKKGEAFFIKPDSGMKEFTGKVINYDNFDHETNSMYQIERVDPESMIVVASPKLIQSEFRYVICNRKIIAKSEYRWDDVLDVRIDTLPECDAMAETVAKLEWQADQVYVCDVAMTDIGPRVIELNAFSSSGLYACDTNAIAREVSIAAFNEYMGDV